MSRKQEIFNTVVTHLRKQGRPALEGTDPDGSCMYLAPDGCKCAAGCLIPPEDYRPEFEGQRVSPYGWFPVSEYFKKRYTPEEINFIGQLQEIHDEVDVREWEAGFAALACDHSLTLPEAA